MQRIVSIAIALTAISASALATHAECHELAYFVIGHTPNNTDWEVFGHFEDKEAAVASLSEHAARGKRCTLLITQVVQQRGAANYPIKNGQFIMFEEFAYRDGDLIPAGPNTYKIQIKEAIVRWIDSAAPDPNELNKIKIPPMAPPKGRPIYVIAHHCNDLEDIKTAIAAGANSIECDLVYGTAGWGVRHPFPEIGDRATPLDDWLTEAANVKVQHLTQFALIYFDIKTPDANAIADLHRKARAAFPGRALPMRLIFSIGDFDDRHAAFSVLKSNLTKNDGVVIDQCEDPAKVQQYFHNQLGVANFWYAYGTFRFGSADGIEPFVKKGCELRDRDRQIKKVYAWTFEKPTSIEHFIKDIGVDGIMVEIGAIGSAVKSAKRHGRLATSRDDPFVLYQP